jgi:hypothetical protein
VIKLIIRTTGIAFLVSAALLVALTAFAAPSRADTGSHVLSTDTSGSSTSATATSTAPLTTPLPTTFTATSTLPSYTSTSTSTYTSTPIPTFTASATPLCGTLWPIVDSPNVGFGNSYLLGVASVAENDVWAVGYYTNSIAIEQTLIEHWDGVRWSVIASPNPGGASSRLEGVSALAANDIWAVGSYQLTSNSETLALTIHWDGSQWAVVSNPGVGTLSAVDAFSPSDIWAVGYVYTASSARSVSFTSPASPTTLAQQWLTLTMHWDGQSWQVIPSPNIDTIINILHGVVDISPTDAWAVGEWGDGQFMALHWDGQMWNTVYAPGPCCFGNAFFGVDALTPNDLWAVGGGSWQPEYAIEDHWDGSGWTIYQSLWGWYWNVLYGVDTIATDDVWAVGIGFPRGMYIDHWNGSQWEAYATPPNPRLITLRGVSAVDANDVWAVGVDGSGNVQKRTAVVHYTGECLSPVPTPTPTACPIEFTDVPSGSTFYPYVRCLACRAVLGGYPDGTFRPNDNLTRGQAAKIVSNAAGFSDDIPPTQQTFTDVPPGSTFWVYVERGYAHGVFSGYPCGGAGEPCDPQQRPYYRPGNNLSRGQLAKVATNGAGYIDQISPDQASFIDVPADDPFWIYVEREVAHSIISGYPCGGGGEPCDEYNRPYYRPAASVSRGQTAKIVSSTFFPDCQTP